MVRPLSHILPVLVLLLVPMGAEARDPDLPPADPKGGWHKITYDNATSTSPCIGKLETPLCAVDTMIAAELRGDQELYSLSRIGKVQPTPWLQPENPNDWHKYRILSSGRFKAGDRHTDDRDHDMHWVPGDVWIVIDLRDCYQNHCSKPAPSARWWWPRRYVIHKSEAGWIVRYAGELHWRQ